MARSDRSQRAASPHAEALAGIWNWAMAPQPSAALRRRVSLWLLIIIFLVLLFTFRVQGVSIWQSLITPANLGHILVGLVAFWMAVNAGAAVLQSLFVGTTTSDSLRHILRRAFGGSYETFSTLGSETDNSSLARSGGPGWLKIHLEHAAVIERTDGSARVLGTSARPVLLDGFERLRTVLHLKEQVLTLNLWARSRDGIRVRVEGARLIFSLLRSKREPSLQQPYPFDANAALDLVIGQCVEASAHHQVMLENSDLVADQGRAFFERQMQDFIGQFNFGELLAGSPLTPGPSPALKERGGKASDKITGQKAGQPETSTPPFDAILSSNLLLARDKLREAFLVHTQEPAAAFGLQINWIDIGTWKLDDRARTALAGQAGVQTAQHEDELAQLIDQLLPEKLQQSGEAWVYDALVNFARFFEELRDEYAELQNESEPQMEAVIRFLNLLTRQRTDKKS